jgi:ornithine--oxo-acid transaminase
MFNLATHSTYWPPFAKMMCQRFGYDRIAAVTSGTEAADNACKIAVKWGITKKGIKPDECLVLGVGESYHGLGTQVWNLQDPSEKRRDYGILSRRYMNVNPTTGELLGYLDLDAMRRCLEIHHHRVSAVILEFLHGTTRDMQQEIDFSRGVYDLCKKYNILCIADEIRQGCGKTGKFFGFNHDGDDCKPDMILLGKLITGCIYRQSYVLGMEKTMGLVGSYEIASTFGFMGIVATEAALQVIDDENLVKRTTLLRNRWREISTSCNHPKIDYIASLGADSNVFLKGVPSPKVVALCMICTERPDHLRQTGARVSRATASQAIVPEVPLSTHSHSMPLGWRP